MNWNEIRSAILGIVAVASAGFLIVWGVGAFFTAADRDYWEQIDNDCYVHITKVNDAWLSKGHSEPAIRTIYCKTDLRGVE